MAGKPSANSCIFTSPTDGQFEDGQLGELGMIYRRITEEILLDGVMILVRGAEWTPLGIAMTFTAWA